VIRVMFFYNRASLVIWTLTYGLSLVGRGFSPDATVPIKPIMRDTCD